MCPNRIASLFYFAINHSLYNISCKVCQVGLWHYEMRNNVRITHISFGSKGQVVKCEWLMTNKTVTTEDGSQVKGKMIWRRSYMKCLYYYYINHSVLGGHNITRLYWWYIYFPVTRVLFLLTIKVEM
jgi:hypothetical protein